MSASRCAEAQLSARLSQQISFLGGLALNEGVNWLIKHVIQEPRPCGGKTETQVPGLHVGHCEEAPIFP